MAVRKLVFLLAIQFVLYDTTDSGHARVLQLLTLAVLSIVSLLLQSHAQPYKETEHLLNRLEQYSWATLAASYALLATAVVAMDRPDPAQWRWTLLTVTVWLLNGMLSIVYLFWIVMHAHASWKARKLKSASGMQQSTEGGRLPGGATAPITATAAPKTAEAPGTAAAAGVAPAAPKIEETAVESAATQPMLAGKGVSAG